MTTKTFFGGSLGRSASTHGARPVTLRLGSNQPVGSPTERRISEMAANLLADTEGDLRVEVFAGGTLGSDNAMIAQVRAGQLDLYLAGANLGEFSTLTEMPNLPFIFKGDQAVFAALDGDLGQLISEDLERNGLHAFRPFLANGFHHLTTTSRPIREAADLRGLTIRTPVQIMPAEFFTHLGATPKAITLDSMYAAMRARIVDGATDPLSVIQALKLHEVQRYLSLTSHFWSGLTLVSPIEIWRRLSPDLQEALSRAFERAALAQRADMVALDRDAISRLQAAGMDVIEADSASFKVGLEPFYAQWRLIYGEPAWRTMEQYTGPVG